jgi:hypothetical protein
MLGKSSCRASPNNFRRHFAQPVLCRIVRENHAEKDGSLSAPVFADFVPDGHDIGGQATFDLVNR